MLMKMQTAMMAMSGVVQMKMIMISVVQLMVTVINLYKSWKGTGKAPVFVKQVHHHHTQEVVPHPHSHEHEHEHESHYRKEDNDQQEFPLDFKSANIPGIQSNQRPIAGNHNPWYRPAFPNLF